MNVERMRRLADALEGAETLKACGEWSRAKKGAATPELNRFNMRLWLDRWESWDGGECGTVGCVAGWAAHMFAEKRTCSVRDDAADALELSVDEADALFAPLRVDLDEVTSEHAALAVRKAASGAHPDDWWEHVEVFE